MFVFQGSSYFHAATALLLVMGVDSGVAGRSRKYLNDVIVETASGRIRGLDDGLTQAFKGVPYAAPPVGNLRWQPPQRPKSWQPNVLDALDDAPGCPQIGCGKLTPPIACPQKLSEDCLYLNVYTTSGAKNGSDLPVMVYLHGGNFFFMSGSSPLFDGEVLAQIGNVVVVTLNYRLGALGFLVTGDTPDDARGNYGLYDQIYALKWVKDNIQQFGGDPNKVTLFGQSAGAQSTLQHMTVAEVSELFQRVIIESSPIALPYKTKAEAYILGGLLAEALGCEVGDMKCMRSKSADEVAEAALSTRSEVASIQFLELFEPYGPYIDGQMVKGQPLDIVKSGQFIKKPMIIGTTREETVLYIYGSYNKSVDLLEYLTLLVIERPDKFIEIAEHYPPAVTSTDQREGLVNVSTDLVFGCPTRNLTRALLSQGEGDVWMYMWDHALSFAGWGNVTFCEGRVCHGSEIVYVFHTADKGNFTFTKEEEQLSGQLMKYWTNFAWTGDPNLSAPFIDHAAKLNFRPAQWSPHASDLRPHDSHKAARIPHRMKVELETSFRLMDKKFRTSLDFMLSSEKLTFDSANRDASPTLEWPKYAPDTQWKTMHFQVPNNEIIENYKSEKCDFWDSIGYSFVK